MPRDWRRTGHDETRAEKIIAVVVLIGCLVLWTVALMLWTPTRSLF